MTIRKTAMVLGVMLSASAHAELNVFACEPEWAALAVELGGDHVDVYSATTELQDAHKVQARPSLIARARSADLLVCSGAELEIGWLPVLLRKSGNSAIQPGANGYLMATDHVELLGKLGHVDRSMGDVHAAGNPHIATDPRRLLQVAKVVSARLSSLDPANASTYTAEHQRFSQAMQQSIAAWQPQLARAAGKSMVVHHDSWLYLEDWAGIKKVATLESKPGVPPSSRHLARLLRQLKESPADKIVYASYQDPRPANWLSRKTKIATQNLPLNPPNWRKRGALQAWYAQLITGISQ